MTISLRTARVSDANAIARLTSQLGYDVPPSIVTARLRSILSRADQQFFVAEERDNPVAWLHAAIIECVEADRFVMVAGLVVDANHRRRGIGRLLMQRAEQWAGEQRCRVIRLWSSAGRAAAHRFYERIGYTNIKTQYSFAKGLSPEGRDDLATFVPRLEADGT